MTDNYIVKFRKKLVADLYTKFEVLTPTSSSSGELLCLPH